MTHLDRGDDPLIEVWRRSDNEPQQLDHEFARFLQSQKIELTLAYMAWLAGSLDVKSPSSMQLQCYLDRQWLIDLVIDAAPWDDHFIAYARNFAMRRMHTTWFVAVAFGEQERLRIAAIKFLRFCRRHGLCTPNSANARSVDSQWALYYLHQWQHQVARKLIGPVLGLFDG